jgi:hypothetical protein
MLTYKIMDALAKLHSDFPQDALFSIWATCFVAQAHQLNRKGYIDKNVFYLATVLKSYIYKCLLTSFTWPSSWVNMLFFSSHVFITLQIKCERRKLIVLNFHLNIDDLEWCSHFHVTGHVQMLGHILFSFNRIGLWKSHHHKEVKILTYWDLCLASYFIRVICIIH